MQYGRRFQFPLIIGLSFLAAMVSSCSGSQQDQEGLENEYSQYGGNYADQGQQGQYSDNNYGGNDYAASNTDDAEAYNSDVGNDTDEYADIPVTNATTDTIDSTLDGSGGYNAAIPMNGAPIDYGQQVATPVPVAGASAPIAGGRVRYVVQGGAQIIDQGGTPVGTLAQGDHPLTWEENGMYRITQGMYVEPGSVSESGVGRPMGGNMWK